MARLRDSFAYSLSSLAHGEDLKIVLRNFDPEFRNDRFLREVGRLNPRALNSSFSTGCIDYATH